MTRDEKAAVRAQGRERRRRPREDELEQDAEPQQEHGAVEENGRRREERPRSAKREPPKGAAGDELGELATRARQLLHSVRGVDAESVSGIVRTANGWKVMLEVVELRRIPESTDVIASYEVELDGDGDFLGFERGRRYHRSQAESGGSR